MIYMLKGLRKFLKIRMRTNSYIPLFKYNNKGTIDSIYQKKKKGTIDSIKFVFKK